MRYGLKFSPYVTGEREPLRVLLIVVDCVLLITLCKRPLALSPPALSGKRLGKAVKVLLFGWRELAAWHGSESE